MIDTHCHLLPGMDDGPESEAEAVALAEQLSALGVERVVCTPHASRLFPTRHEAAARQLHLMRRLLASADVPLGLELAAEISPARAVSDAPAELRRRAIGGRFSLVELEPDTPSVFLTVAVERLSDVGLGLVLAHPERCRAVQRQPDLLDEARSAGVLVQVVAPSLTERWGVGVAATAWALVDAGRVDLVASDAHRPRPRPSLAEAKRLLIRRFGEDTWRLLTHTAPEAMLGGRHPHPGLGAISSDAN
jgi:protein-tyrosine phosphatase